MRNTTTGKVAYALLAVCLLAMPKALAQDFPQDIGNSLRIYSETKLSGIDVSNGTIDGAIRRFGKPRHTIVSHGFGLDQAASIDGIYEWESANWRLKVVVRGDFDRRGIEQIDVWGTHADAAVGSTGRGLKLGDTVTQARCIYRLPMCFASSVPDSHPFTEANPDAYYQPVLEVDFDKGGKVNHMRLINPCALACY